MSCGDDGDVDDGPDDAITRWCDYGEHDGAGGETARCVRVTNSLPPIPKYPNATQILTDPPLTIRHTFEAGVVCFSFDPRKRHRKTLAEVHAPVPGYERKMRDAVARVFTKLKTEQTAVARKLGFAKFRRSRVNRPRVAPDQRGDRRRR